MPFIHKDLAEAARRFPDHLAVWSESGALTYRELNDRSSSLAAWLQGHDAGPGERIGILLPRRAEALVAIFGILKSGAAYIPFDPSWPENHILKILKDCSLKILISSLEGEEITRHVSQVLYLDTAEWQKAIAEGSRTQEGKDDVPKENLAYILYTSGSTGDPKGVCISHRAARYFANWARKEFNISKNDRIASVSPFTFDLSTFDLFSGLAGGAILYLVSSKTKMLPSQLSRFLEEHEITVIYAVPSTLAVLALRGLLKKRRLASMRLVLFAGEVFPPAQLRRLMEQLPDHVQYHNLYGPTETNVCTWYPVRDIPRADKPIPIGKPLSGTRIFILPDEDTPNNNGMAGELCVAGPGVMSGYWGRQDDGSNYWIGDPENLHSRAYRTGDLAKMREDGNWLYKGRKDHQIKTFGYRVEPGEIESCLLKFPDVNQAVVIKMAGNSLGETLVAFVVGQNGLKESRLDVKALYEHCKVNLPKYKVPSHIQQIEEFPLTHSGKINRSRLRARAEAQSEFSLPPWAGSRA